MQIRKCPKTLEINSRVGNLLRLFTPSFNVLLDNRHFNNHSDFILQFDTFYLKKSSLEFFTAVLGTVSFNVSILNTKALLTLLVNSLRSTNVQIQSPGECAIWLNLETVYKLYWRHSPKLLVLMKMLWLTNCSWWY